MQSNTGTAAEHCRRAQDRTEAVLIEAFNCCGSQRRDYGVRLALIPKYDHLVADAQCYRPILSNARTVAAAAAIGRPPGGLELDQWLLDPAQEWPEAMRMNNTNTDLRGLLQLTVHIEIWVSDNEHHASIVLFDTNSCELGYFYWDGQNFTDDFECKFTRMVEAMGRRIGRSITIEYTE